ncbi:Ras-specific guanine nucleotide-releasing factor 1 [Liparis tanakae]|uniref:Ras-specific guanine nucleotide-releasing factor 1 n=1 Tax=Liparis tanakae TaxID=230148 RepID=A0A4Z2E3V0_9TELE|nr:Ras-specific guanine nucleotide-releasing factor 1 [Liparis tanakae]
MLNIYQEFVRNHQYSLQILAHCKQNRDFDKLLKQYEAKPDCEERTLETFLTYPMFQVRLLITVLLHNVIKYINLTSDKRSLCSCNTEVKYIKIRS